MHWSAPTGSLDIQTLQAHYQTGALTPEQVVQAVYDRIDSHRDDPIWISLVARQRALERARQVRHQAHQPLAGIPFAAKDNIDVAGSPTTVACPEFAYVPDQTASVIKRLENAGAILVGKTNLDQFATGLVGTRSPYGIPCNPFHRDYIPGGSSSGSAVAVAAGLVSFALGTDTAGSGRIPAGFNNLVGLKPTPGLLSTAGVFPACRSLDCVSIFTLTVEDAERVLDVCAGYDADDIYSVAAPAETPGFAPDRFAFGVPQPSQRRFFGNPDYAGAYDNALHVLETLGGGRVEIDFAPFTEVAELLYAGPWIAERLAALGSFFYHQPQAIHPVTRAILSQAEAFSAVDAFQAQYQLRALARQGEAAWGQATLLVLPTAGGIYTLRELESDPIGLNAHLGYYTNFVNLLGFSALALPAGLTAAGLPAGITLIAPAFCEAALLALGRRFHRTLGGRLGATETLLSSVGL